MIKKKTNKLVGLSKYTLALCSGLGLAFIFSCSNNESPKLDIDKEIEYISVNGERVSIKVAAVGDLTELSAVGIGKVDSMMYYVNDNGDTSKIKYSEADNVKIEVDGESKLTVTDKDGNKNVINLKESLSDKDIKSLKSSLGSEEDKAKAELNAQLYRKAIFVNFDTDDTLDLIKSRDKNGVGKINIDEVKAMLDNTKDKSVFLQAATVSSYVKGRNSLMKYLGDNMNYPKEAKEKGIEEDVYVKFIISTKGDIEDVNVVKGENEALKTEAVRVVKSIPGKWHPAVKNGKKVNSEMTLPITFKLG